MAEPAKPKIDLKRLWGDLYEKHVVILYAARVYHKDHFPWIDSEEEFPFYQAIVRELLEDHLGRENPWYVFHASRDKKHFYVGDSCHLVYIPTSMERVFAPGSVWHEGQPIHAGRPSKGGLILQVDSHEQVSSVSLMDLRRRAKEEDFYNNLLPWLGEEVGRREAVKTLENTLLFEVKGVNALGGKPVVCYIPMMELARFLFMRSNFLNMSLFDHSLMADAETLNPMRFRKLDKEEIELETSDYDPNIPVFWMYRHFSDSDALVLERLWSDKGWRRAAFSLAGSVGEDKSEAARRVKMFWPWDGSSRSVRFELHGSKLKKDGSVWIAPRILGVEEIPEYVSDFELWTAETGRRRDPDDPRGKAQRSDGEQFDSRRYLDRVDPDDATNEINVVEQPHNEAMPLSIELEDPDEPNPPNLKKRKIKSSNARRFEKRSEEQYKRIRRALSPHVPQGMDDGERPHPGKIGGSAVCETRDSDDRMMELAEAVSMVTDEGIIVRIARRKPECGDIVLERVDARLLASAEALAERARIQMACDLANANSRCRIGGKNDARPRLVALYILESNGSSVVVFLPMSDDKSTFAVRMGKAIPGWGERDAERFLRSMCRKGSTIDDVMERFFSERHKSVKRGRKRMAERIRDAILELLS